MKVLGKIEGVGVIFKPDEVFKACRDYLDNEVKLGNSPMYMNSENETIHWFKDSITRKSTKVSL